MLAETEVRLMEVRNQSTSPSVSSLLFLVLMFDSHGSDEHDRRRLSTRLDGTALPAAQSEHAPWCLFQSGHVMFASFLSRNRE
jgi:hypothetical protein